MFSRSIVIDFQKIAGDVQLVINLFVIFYGGDTNAASHALLTLNNSGVLRAMESPRFYTDIRSPINQFASYIRSHPNL